MAFDDFPNAIADFSRSIKLDPTRTNAYANRSGVYYQSGDLKNAPIDAKKACELGNCQTLEYLKKRGAYQE